MWYHYKTPTNCYITEITILKCHKGNKRRKKVLKRKRLKIRWSLTDAKTEAIWTKSTSLLHTIKLVRIELLVWNLLILILLDFTFRKVSRWEKLHDRDCRRISLLGLLPANISKRLIIKANNQKWQIKLKKVLEKTLLTCFYSCFSSYS